MKCPKCDVQYDIYNAAIAENEEDEGLWVCPDCKVMLDETDSLENYKPKEYAKDKF